MGSLSLGARLGLLFAACTAVVSLGAGILFNRASEAHFMELDQQLLDSRLPALRVMLSGVDSAERLAARKQALEAELVHQPDMALTVSDANGQPWFDNAPHSTQAAAPDDTGLHTERHGDITWRAYRVALRPGDPGSPLLTLRLDITHHQHFLERMQRLIWLTVGLSALTTALLGAWAARSGLRPLRRMSEVATGVSASSLTTRLPEQGMPRELADLAQSFNAMLERLDDAFQRLSAFSADIAHELRTPLSNLLTQTQVILTRPRSLEEYRDTLLGNLEEMQWMAQLVNDMLLLAKADHGLLQPRREVLELEREVAALIEFFTPLAEDVGVRLHGSGEARVMGDRSMLRRALSNLLDNALRFTPEGGEVTITLERRAGQATLTVSNTGKGIDPARAPRLFDRFYRADPARHEGSEHAGLGLAITRSIIEAHGGTIRCESDNGSTRFIVDLPTSHPSV